MTDTDLDRLLELVENHWDKPTTSFLTDESLKEYQSLKSKIESDLEKAESYDIKVKGMVSVIENETKLGEQNKELALTVVSQANTIKEIKENLDYNRVRVRELKEQVSALATKLNGYEILK